MQVLVQILESQLAALPVPVALRLPGGEFEGGMRDVMAAAVGLLPGSPEASDTSWWTQLLRRTRSLASHTPQRDAEQIRFHYDVSDAFYALSLDPLRVYSCAYFAEDDMSLAEAQRAKLDLICRKLMLAPGERCLDIGAGWGGLLLWAAEHYGVTATGITVSRNQHDHVQHLIEDKGLQGRVQVRLQDYRDLDESQPFDKIASVGMFEHVGQASMPAYFRKIHALLRPGGLVMNHGITAGGTEPGELGAGMGEFISKYIFPGRELLHVRRVGKRSRSTARGRVARRTDAAGPRASQRLVQGGSRAFGRVAERAKRRMGRPKAHVTLAGGPLSRGAVAVGCATSPSALRRRTVLL